MADKTWKWKIPSEECAHHGQSKIFVILKLIQPPIVEPVAAIPDETAAAPTVPDAPATVDDVEAAVPAVARAPAVPAMVDGLVILIFLLQIEQVRLNYLLNNLTTISLPG